MDALQEEIHGEIKRLFGLENVYAWLASAQPLLDMRIPARMMASGEGRVLLQVLRDASAP